LEEDPDTVVMILTADSDAESAAQAFRLGVTDYLLKPPNPHALLDAIEKALARRAQNIFHRDAEAWLRKEVDARTRELQEKTALLERVTVGALSALVRTLEQRTPHFRGHSTAVGELSEAIATTLGLPGEEVDACRTAGFLHDIGMIAIPDRILEKSQALTPEESRRVQEHCRIGREILEPFPHLGPVPDYIYLHHERVDGSGYPDGRKGSEIPMGAQVVGVADSFRALVEERPYRPAHSASEAVEILIGASGIWHSPEILKALARLVPSIQS
jgi:putative nucleotidyltransferase with HDIG domain